MPIWLVLAGRNGGLRGARTAETHRNSSYRSGNWAREAVYSWPRARRGVRISAIVVLLLLSSLLLFYGFVISQWRKGSERRRFDAASSNSTVSAGSNSHHWESFILR